VNGVVQVLYAGTGGLRGNNSQLFRQGAGGVAGTPTNGEQFGRSLTA
jgi:hypothetical protein